MVVKMIQKIKLNKGQTITRSNIQSILTNAKMSYDYAEFKMDNDRYLTVTFTKDGKYEVATNVREQWQLFYEIKILKQVNSFYALVDFMFKWLNNLNKK